jgi:hypothetical protein
MCRTPQILRVLPLVLVLAVVACSQAPRMSQENETDYVRMLREEFFKTHPDGLYNDHIARGEVVRGMDFLEVLASWGNPGSREKPADNVEYWMYTDEDEDSKDVIQYKFIFRKNCLDDWELTRHVAAGGILDTTKKQTQSVLTRSGSGSTKSTPKKW